MLSSFGQFLCVTSGIRTPVSLGALVVRTNWRSVSWKKKQSLIPATLVAVDGPTQHVFVYQEGACPLPKLYSGTCVIHFLFGVTSGGTFPNLKSCYQSSPAFLTHMLNQTFYRLRHYDYNWILKHVGFCFTDSEYWHCSVTSFFNSAFWRFWQFTARKWKLKTCKVSREGQLRPW